MITALQHKIDQKTKPVGALGALEALAAQVGVIQQTLTPSIRLPHIVVFAADHGIAATGLVNPYPQAVTAQMVLNFTQGGAAINVFCRQNNIDLTIVDAGVNFDFAPDLAITHAKIAKGTNNYINGDAMSATQLAHCLQQGKAIIQQLAEQGCNTIGFGEMGIGNTSSASLLMHYYLQIPIADCVGRGTGVNDAQLTQKIETLNAVSIFHQLNERNKSAEAVLQSVGGFEIAMMAGAYLSALQHNMVIVVDGFIATAALLAALELDSSKQLLSHCVFAHCSGEQGHQKILRHLGVSPLLQLGLRLGEGTGAALAMPLIQNAVAFLNQMASFEDAGVSNKD